MPRAARTAFPVLAYLPHKYTGATRHLYGVVRPLRHAQWVARDTGRRFLRNARPAVAAQTITACLRLPLPPFQARSSSSSGGVSMAASAWSVTTVFRHDPNAFVMIADRDDRKFAR